MIPLTTITLTKKAQKELYDVVRFIKFKYGATLNYSELIHFLSKEYMDNQFLATSILDLERGDQTYNI